MGFVPLVMICMYLALCLLYAYFLGRKKKDWQYGVFTLIVCLALPGVGFVFLWICDAFSESRRPEEHSELYVDENYKPENLQIMQKLDYEKESNYVSMNEALTVSTFDYRRKMIMQLLEEEDTMQYLDVLHTALLNEDTETSHYASTVIMELQRKVQEELIEKEVRFENDPDDLKSASEWEEVLYRVLCSDLYDDFNKRRYFIKYGKVSDKLLTAELPGEVFLKNRIHISMMEKNFTEAHILCTRYLECYPESEDAVLCQMECFVQAKDSEGMEKFLQALSERPVLLTKKTLEYVRIFKRG